MIKILEKEGKFIAISTEDNSISIGDNLEEAYSKAKKDFDNDKIDKNNFNEEPKLNIINNLGIFYLKLVSVFLFIFIFSFFLINQLKNSANDFNARFDNVGGSNFWNKIEKEIISSASEENAISEEKKQKILNALKIHVQNYKPFIKEINKLFEEED
ncbi:hypothetical protein OA960_00750 [Pelagibacteraceae bacterium]|nr:hypothetical protein [Pelagibacteraceae bacterium]